MLFLLKYSIPIFVVYPFILYITCSIPAWCIIFAHMRHGSPLTIIFAPSSLIPSLAALQIAFISAWWHPISFLCPDGMPISFLSHTSPPHNLPPPLGPPLYPSTNTTFVNGSTTTAPNFPLGQLEHDANNSHCLFLISCILLIAKR